MKRHVAALLVVLSTVAGCREAESPVDPLQPRSEGLRRAISDGANGGNRYFYFLQPVAPADPAPTGVFNPNLRPTVTICELANPTSCIANFSGPAVAVSTTDQHYKVNWDTEANPGTPGSYYRITVAVSGAKVAFADVYVASTAKDLKRTVDNTTFGLVDGRTLPIKFRIEHGVLSYQRYLDLLNDGDNSNDISEPVCSDCVEQPISTTSTTTQTVTVPSKDAGVSFPADASGNSFTGTLIETLGVSEVTIAINEILTRPCLGTPQPEAGECYSFDALYTDPSTGETKAFTDYFNTSYRPTVGVCIDAALRERARLAKRSFAGPEEGVRLLDPVAENFLDCSVPLALLEGSSKLARLVNAGWNALARAVAPGLLHAGDTGSGGLAGTFSYVTWLQEVEITASAGDGQTAPVSTMVPTAPQVLVENVDHVTGTRYPVQNMAVTFTVMSGGGSVGSTNALTDANGYASMPWTLGATVGSQTMVASIQVATTTGTIARADTFTATATSAAQITSVQLASSTMVIDGARVSYTATLENQTGATITSAAVQTWIEQGTAKRAAGGVVTSCPNTGELAVGTCTVSFTIGASNASTTAGTGTLVPGSATANFELKSGSMVLHTYSVPVTLTQPDLALGFVSPQTAAPVQLWRFDGQAWVQATGSPLTVYSGEDIELRAYFKNAGNAEVASGFTARMRFDSNTAWAGFSWPLGTLLLTTQGYMAMQQTNIAGPTSGCTTALRVAEVELDDGLVIAESSETNNVAMLSYQVCAPGPL